MTEPERQRRTTPEQRLMADGRRVREQREAPESQNRGFPSVQPRPSCGVL